MDNPIIETKTETEQTKKKKKLTIREREFIQYYIKTGNATTSAMKAYRVKSKESAASIGSELLKKLDYTELMEQMGISDQILLKTLQEGLKATKLFGKEAVEHADYQARHRFMETGLKLKKRLTDKEDNNSNTLIGLSIVVQSKE